MWIDASTFIALDMELRRLVGPIKTTAVAEVIGPARAGLEEAISRGHVEVVDVEGAIEGLGAEAGLIIAGDVLVLDDLAARREAKARGLRVTGLLGLLIHGARTGRVEALAVLERLLKSDFRMSAELYARCRAELEDAGRPSP